MALISLFSIFVVVFVSLISLSHAQEDWEEVAVLSTMDNKTEYIFSYSAENIVLEQIFGDKMEYPFPEMRFNTVNNINGSFKLKIPKNFPMESHSDLVTIVTYSNSSKKFILTDKHTA